MDFWLLPIQQFIPFNLFLVVFFIIFIPSYVLCCLIGILIKRLNEVERLGVDFIVVVSRRKEERFVSKRKKNFCKQKKVWTFTFITNWSSLQKLITWLRWCWLVVLSHIVMVHLRTEDVLQTWKLQKKKRKHEKHGKML